jgi:hypothetical protein
MITVALAEIREWKLGIENKKVAGDSWKNPGIVFLLILVNAEASRWKGDKTRGRWRVPSTIEAIAFLPPRVFSTRALRADYPGAAQT